MPIFIFSQRYKFYEMAKNILNEKVGDFTLLDGGIIALAEVGSQLLFKDISFIGDGTIKSGLIKVGLAFASSLLTKNKYIQYIASGVLIDGFQDVIIDTTNNLSSGTSGEVVL